MNKIVKVGTNWIMVFFFFTGPNPIIVYIVIFSKIMIKIVKVGNRIMFLKRESLRTLMRQ